MRRVSDTKNRIHMGFPPKVSSFLAQPYYVSVNWVIIYPNNCSNIILGVSMRAFYIKLIHKLLELVEQIVFPGEGGPGSIN
jgi:hypothetical protein